MDPRIRSTAQEQAYSFLRDAILDGVYPGGTRIDVPAVAQRLGMSRMPVREALRQLDAEGLVTIRPNRGATVTVLTPADILEVFEMRAVLEGLAARLAVGHLDDEAFEDLERSLSRMERNQDNTAQWLRHHNDFHELICARSGRPRLVAQVRLLRRAVEPYMRVHMGAYAQQELPGSEHGQLLTVLRRRAPDQAERAMREHVERAAIYVVDFLKSVTTSAADQR
jgi:DNA-binding GntR family transcriptional regulator